MNRDDASKETEADGRMMIDGGWQKQEMVRPVQAQACPPTGLMRARQRSEYAPAKEIKTDKHIKDSSTCRGKKENLFMKAMSVLWCSTLRQL